MDFGAGQRRFDAAIEYHDHIRCISCQRVDDIPLGATSGLDYNVQNTISNIWL
ncbi:MAG: hypothetical protein JW920_09650 [Deltaproteobacteria bacterium]|nr:hypothetical protein [Deltaproteobacteria bacterium]